MEERKRCTLAWCESLHNDDKPNRATHRKTLLETEIVTVTAHWTERHDGRPSVGPLVTVNAATLPGGLDLSPSEAVQLCDTLCALWEDGGVLGFAASLAAGAAVLAAHDTHDTNEPLYVAENAPEGDDE